MSQRTGCRQTNGRLCHALLGLRQIRYCSPTQALYWKDKQEFWPYGRGISSWSRPAIRVSLRGRSRNRSRPGHRHGSYHRAAPAGGRSRAG